MAYIETISSLGEVTIKFSTPMRNESVNVTHLNETVLDIYVEPQGNWHLEEGNSLSQLNFTWNVTKYTSERLFIKLNFSHPLSISPKQIQDTIVVHIKDRRDFFISSTLLVDLHANYTTLKSAMKKQMPDDNITRNLLAASEAADSSLRTTLVGSIIMNIMIKGAMHLFLGMINNLQVIVHIPMLNVVIPANVMQIYKIILPLVMFDILEDMQILQQIFPESEADAE
jgi:hypothetical protein